MKATITLPDRTKIDVDASLQEIMRLVAEHSAIDVDASLQEIMRLVAEHSASVFIPACTCDSTFPCLQHPRFPRRIDG